MIDNLTMVRVRVHEIEVFPYYQFLEKDHNNFSKERSTEIPEYLLSALKDLRRLEQETEDQIMDYIEANDFEYFEKIIW